MTWVQYELGQAASTAFQISGAQFFLMRGLSLLAQAIMRRSRRLHQNRRPNLGSIL